MKKEGGQLFEEQLTRAGVKPADAARAFDETPQTINNWLKRGVSKARVVAVADFLGCKPQELDPDYRPAKGASKITTMINDEEFESLLKIVTPRSRSALTRIAAAAEAGKLSEADITLLEQIADRFLGTHKQ